jgi:hypothetical protein
MVFNGSYIDIIKNLKKRVFLNILKYNYFGLY